MRNVDSGIPLCLRQSAGQIEASGTTVAEVLSLHMSGECVLRSGPFDSFIVYERIQCQSEEPQMFLQASRGR